MATGTIKSTGWKLLWTNPNPGANFPTQTVAVDSTGFDKIAISFVDEGNSPGTFLYSKSIGDNKFVSYVRTWGGNNPGGQVFQRFFSISNTNISFQNCRTLMLTGGTYSDQNTSAAKPFQIFGVD